MNEMYPNQRKLLIAGAVVIAVFMIPFLIFSAQRSTPSTTSNESAANVNGTSTNTASANGTANGSTEEPGTWDPNSVIRNPPAPDIPTPKPNAEDGKQVSEDHITGKGTPEMIKIAHDIIDNKMEPAQAGMLLNEKGYIPTILSLNGEKQKNTTPPDPTRFGLILNGETGHIIVTDIQLGE